MYRTIHTILRYDTIRYDSYNMYTVSYGSWALTIRRYNTELFTHDTIRIVYRMILSIMLDTFKNDIFFEFRNVARERTGHNNDLDQNDIVDV